MKELKQNVDKLKDKIFAGDVERFLFAAKEIGGLKVVTASRDNISPDDLRKMGDFLKDKAPNSVAVLAGVNDGKITLLAISGKEAMAKGIKAGDLIKSVAKVCGGSGGGKPDSAMGGAKDILKLDDALASVDDFVAAKLGL